MRNAIQRIYISVPFQGHISLFVKVYDKQSAAFYSGEVFKFCGLFTIKKRAGNEKRAKKSPYLITIWAAA